MHHPWNYHSAVTCCETCNGAGRVHSHHLPTINDPYPESACPDCDGEHLPECKVCGCEILVPGYDCMACFVAEELPVAHLNDADIEQLGKAIMVAARARQTEQRRAA